MGTHRRAHDPGGSKPTRRPERVEEAVFAETLAENVQRAERRAKVMGTRGARVMEERLRRKGTIR